MKFDFNEWANLHAVDPEAFEQRRGAVLESVIQSVPEGERRHALEQTLFRIEMIRRRAKSPLKAALDASNLMWESFGKLRENIDQLQKEAQGAGLPSNGLRLIQPEQPKSAFAPAEEPHVSAKVIPLGRGSKQDPTH